MANHLAERISDLKDLSGEKLISEKKECFELILKLWRYRDHLPDASKPFGNYQEIFRALESLDPEASPYRYFSINDDYPESLDEDIKLWLDFSKKIDVLARTMISFSLKEALNKATDENIKSWIETVQGTIPNNEMKVVFKTLSNGIGVNSSDEDLLRVNKEKLSNRIDQIDQFMELSTFIRKMLSDELESLEDVEDDSRGHNAK